MQLQIPNEFARETFPESFRDFEPESALILGSFLGGFVDQVEVIAVCDYAEISGLPTSRIPGQHGRLIAAQLAGHNILIAQGRVHLYEGFSAKEATALVRLFDAASIERVILTASATALNAYFMPGNWMTVNDHLNLMGTSPLLGGPHLLDMSAIYSGTMRRHFNAVADEQDIPLLEGTLAGVLGPENETPAEGQMLKNLGADASATSIVLEAIQSCALGMETVGLACLTRWGAGLSQEPVSHEEVLDIGERASEQLVQLLEVGLGNLDDSKIVEFPTIT